MELTVQLESLGPPYPLKLQIVSRSDQGDRSENQDAIRYKAVGEWFVCALADGAGGHQGGRVAAHQAVNSFLNFFEAGPTLHADALTALVHQVNQRILDSQQSNRVLNDMHTTLCVLVLNQRTRAAVWLHVGDSRVYRFHQDRLLSRTKDHSILQWMADQPVIDVPLVVDHQLVGHQHILSMPTRNALYTALGEPPSELRVDVSQVYVAAPGDWFLLCSDGLWEHFNDAELGLLGSKLWSQHDCCAHIHHLALSRAAYRADNLSSIFLFIGEKDHPNG